RATAVGQSASLALAQRHRFANRRRFAPALPHLPSLAAPLATPDLDPASPRPPLSGSMEVPSPHPPLFGRLGYGTRFLPFRKAPLQRPPPCPALSLCR